MPLFSILVSLSDGFPLHIGIYFILFLLVSHVNNSIGLLARFLLLLFQPGCFLDSFPSLQGLFATGFLSIFCLIGADFFHYEDIWLFIFIIVIIFRHSSISEAPLFTRRLLGFQFLWFMLFIIYYISFSEHISFLFPLWRFIHQPLERACCVFPLIICHVNAFHMDYYHVISSASLLATSLGFLIFLISYFIW